MPVPPPTHLNDLTRRILKCAYQVHAELGPGLLESVYQVALAYELEQAGIAFQLQPGVPVTYKEVKLEAGLRPDFIVEHCVVIELKAIDALHPVHDAQVLIYLKLTRCRVGLLLNFNVVSLKDGIRRLVL